MKLFTGIAISLTVLLGTEEFKRPDPFFTDGNILVYESIASGAKGKSNRIMQSIRVEKVFKTAHGIQSECTMGYFRKDKPDDITPSYRLTYAADSVNFYSFTENWCYVPFHVEEYISYEVSGDSLIYPLHMKVGDTLETAQASTRYSIYKTRVAYTVTFTGRKVIATDTIATAFGSVPAYRLSMHAHYAVQSYDTETGGDRNLENMEITEWFSPQYGIIKMTYNTADSDLSSEMISYKGK